MSKKNDANVDEDTRMTFTTMTVKERMNLWRQRDVDNKDQLQPNPRIKIPTYSPTVDRGQRKRLSVSVSCFRSSFNQSSTNSEDLKSINQLKLLPPILPSIVSTPPNLSPNSRKSQQISASKQTAQIPCDIMEVRGVTVSFLHSFVEKCGGRASLVGKTTEEVCALFIYPQCLKSGQSLCDIYNDDAGVRTTSWFVSHSVLGLFLDLVDSLCDTLAEMKCSDDALWIDLFSIPQLGQSTSNLLISNEWSKKVLPKVMRATGSRVLGVIAPWDNPSILTCLDCLYELFLCYQLKGRFQGATTANERTLLLQSVVKDQDIFFSVLNAVSSEQASGGSELETIALRTLVRSCVPATTSSSSYQSLNAVAYHLLDSWLEQLLLSQCRPEQAHSSADRLSYHITLAAIYESKERPAEAENIYKTCLSDCDAMQNDSSIHSIRVVALGRLASLLQVCSYSTHVYHTGCAIY